MQELVILFVVAFVVGIMGGMVGIGGAVFLLPVLMYGLAWPEKLAQGTTLAMLLPPVSLLAVWQYYRMGEIRIKPAVVLAICFIPGAYAGGILGNVLSPEILSKIFGVFAMLVALKFLWPGAEKGEGTPPAEPGESGKGDG